MKRWLPIALGVAVLLWLSLYLNSGRERRAAPAGGTASSASAPVEHSPPRAPPAAEPAAPTPPAAAPATPPSAQPAPEPRAAQPGAAALPPPKEMPAPETTGPVEELKSIYATTPRDSDASALEGRIRALFGVPEVPADILRAASCHQTVCKIEMRWSPERAQAFMQVMMQMVVGVGRQMAWEPVGPRDGKAQALDVYVVREVEPPAQEPSP